MTKNNIWTFWIIIGLTISCNSNNDKTFEKSLQTDPSQEVTHKFKNVSFTLSNKFKKQYKHSNSDMIMFSDDSFKIFGVKSIKLQSDQMNMDLSSLTTSELNEYGKMITNENRKEFTDITYISATHTEIGGIKAIRILQNSKSVSGNNKNINIALYCVLADPYYHSIRIGSQIQELSKFEETIRNNISIQ